MNKKINNESIYSLSYDELQNVLIENSFEKYRTKQIYQFLYDKEVKSFGEMKNIPKKLVDFLEDQFTLKALDLETVQISERKDSHKYLFNLDDGNQIESVLIKDGIRNTLCISSQVGCPLNCQFCATGTMGIIRNLSAGEIVNQYVYVKGKHGTIDNIVYMGMGEPLLNYNNVMKSIRILNDERGLNVGIKRITISTAGIERGIKRLADENLNFNLAVSLNAPEQDLRSKIMPFSKKIPLKDLLSACKEYQEKTGKRITFEYVCIKNLNMERVHSKKIIKLKDDLKFNLNLIPYNPIEGSELESPEPEDMDRFESFFEFSRLEVVKRKRKGRDIAAACGQLVTMKQEESVE